MPVELDRHGSNNRLSQAGTFAGENGSARRRDSERMEKKNRPGVQACSVLFPPNVPMFTARPTRPAAMPRLLGPGCRAAARGPAAAGAVRSMISERAFRMGRPPGEGEGPPWHHWQPDSEAAQAARGPSQCHACGLTDAYEYVRYESRENLRSNGI